MSDKDKTLEQYLLESDVKVVDFELSKDITENEEMLASVANAWSNEKEAITAVIQNRIDQIQRRLLFECSPYEVRELRQALATLLAVLHDFEKYTAEFGKRKESTQEKAKTVGRLS